MITQVVHVAVILLWRDSSFYCSTRKTISKFWKFYTQHNINATHFRSYLCYEESPFVFSFCGVLVFVLFLSSEVLQFLDKPSPLCFDPVIK